MDTGKVYFAVVGLAVTVLTPVLVALVNYAMQDRQARINRRKERISEQIQHLYGQLIFYADMNRHYFDRNQELGTNYMATQASISGDINAKLNLTDAAVVMRNYEEEVKQNSARMIDIIRENSAFIHVDDLRPFRRFVADHNRPRVEKDMPDLLIDPDIGAAWWQPDICGLIVSRFTELSNELESLSRPSRWRWWPTKKATTQSSAIA